MGLTGKSDGLKTYYLKVQGLKKGSKEPTHLKARYKDGDEYKEIEEIFFQVEGRFDGVQVKEFEYEGKTKHALNINLIDDAKKERYVLQLGFNSLLNGIVNSMAGNEIGKLMIRVYNNDAGYPASYVEVNGEKSEWTYDMKEWNKMITRKELDGEVITSRKKLDAHLISEVIPTIKVDALAQAEADMEEYGVEDKSKDIKALHEETVEEEDDDDLPF